MIRTPERRSTGWSCNIDRNELERRKQTVIRRVQTIRSDVWDRRAKRRAAEQGGPVELEQVAVKVADGAERGYVPVIVELLRHFGLWETVPDELLRFVTAPVRNTNKEIVGEARSVFEVPAGW